MPLSGSREKSGNCSDMLWSQVNEMLVAKNAENADVIAFLEQAVNEAARDEPQFIRALVTTVIESCLGMMAFQSISQFHICCMMAFNAQIIPYLV